MTLVRKGGNGCMVKAMKAFEIEIDKDEVCRYLGYRNGQGPNSSISSVMDEEIDEAYQLIQPWCCYQLMNIRQIRQPRIILEDGLTITSVVLSRILYPCHQIAIFLATIGQNLEDRVTHLMDEEQMLRATVLDAVGSEAAEKTVGYLQERLGELAAADGTETTLRYSPGYCDWDITQQRVLFQAMNSAPLTLTLTENCLMVPRKSVSGVIGLGQFGNYRPRYLPCRLCTMVDCQSRR